MKNIDVIKSLPINTLAILFIKEEVDGDCCKFISLSGRLFDDYDDAVRDCVVWLNANCE